MKSTTYAFAAAQLASMVAAHGFVTSPQARMPGSAMSAACGQQLYSQQTSDNYGNVQGELQIASSQSDYDAAACEVWLCKGYKYDDNKANVQTYTAGQVVPITVDIRAPHTGTANVSIVDTASNSIIGSTLKSWDVYASNSATIPDSDKNFDITIPSDLGSQCSTPGACVIQWWWNAASIDQTYESCIDFTVGGSSGGSSSSVAAVSSAASISVSSAAAINKPVVTPAASSSFSLTPIATPASPTPYASSSSKKKCSKSASATFATSTKKACTKRPTAATLAQAAPTVTETATATAGEGVAPVAPVASAATQTTHTEVVTVTVPAQTVVSTATVTVTASAAGATGGADTCNCLDSRSEGGLLSAIKNKIGVTQVEGQASRRHARDIVA